MDAKHIGLGLNIEVVEGDVELKAVSDILQKNVENVRGKCSQRIEPQGKVYWR